MKRRLHVPFSTLCLGVLLSSTALVTDGFAPTDMTSWAQSSSSDTTNQTTPSDTTLPPSTAPTAPPTTPPDTASNPDATSQTGVTIPPAGAQASAGFDGRYDFATQTDLFPSGSYSAEELIGLSVQNASGENVATISDIIVDRTGAAKKIVLSEGGVLGVGARLVAVPASAIKPVMQNNAWSHATVEQATLLPLANQKEFRYETAASATAPITGTPPTTPSPLPNSTPTTPMTPPAPAPDSTTTTPMTTPATGFDTLASDEFSTDRLIDSEIRNSQGQTLATIEDVLFTSDNKASAAVLSVGGFLSVSNKHVALDFQDLQLAQGGSTVPQIVLSIPKEQLEAAPNVTARANAPWGSL
jgi:sporulation protein YlmC with PRC-barrel domain